MTQTAAFLRPFLREIVSEVIKFRDHAFDDLQIDRILKKCPPEKFLEHLECPLSSGGRVVLLDTGALIDPEAVAMLQAMYSRDPASVYTHLAKVVEKGASAFMTLFYVGYGHKSIADCATATFFIEGVSMLACKAIQDFMLYAGQEASTRYIDFGTSVFLDPVKSSDSGMLLEEFRAFYVRNMPKVQDHLATRDPYQEEWDAAIYKKTIRARAFDVLRGFLPAGAQSSAAWHANLRQVGDRLMHLRHHPLLEVREIAAALEKVCLDRYASSFGHKRYPATEGYNNLVMSSSYYYDVPSIDEDVSSRSVNVRSQIDMSTLGQLSHVKCPTSDEEVNLLAIRPEWTELPKWFAQAGTMKIECMLDFGSFRDLQRQRSLQQRMPLLTIRHGFEYWYLTELPLDVCLEAQAFLARVEEFVQRDHGVDDGGVSMQYYIPMGYKVPCSLVGDLPAVLYVVERRARHDVHPTLRVKMFDLADILRSKFSNFGLVVHTDPVHQAFSIKRGTQDIVKKDTA